uniref:Uncharacterized protein n=1 Tax=Cacopsylla melanoneura TaxID=428564 RepID=A0A8D8VZ15_9HEMI
MKEYSRVSHRDSTKQYYSHVSPRASSKEYSHVSPRDITKEYSRVSPRDSTKQGLKVTVTAREGIESNPQSDNPNLTLLTSLDHLKDLRVKSDHIGKIWVL